MRKLVSIALLSAVMLLPLSGMADSWSYQLIFRPTDIPLPASAPRSAVVTQVYSPYVVRPNGMYYMFFGVAVQCQSGAVVRDSIAVAVSADGVTGWQFLKYVIEPDPTVCFNPIQKWTDGALLQTNDPAVIFQNGQFLVFYTAAFYNFAINNGIGHIGLAVFDANLNLLSRNDHYLDPPPSFNTPGLPGVARPAIEQYGRNSFSLWYDVGGNVFQTWINSLINLNLQPQANMNVAGAVDVDITDLGSTQILMSSGGSSGILFKYRLAAPGKSWTPQTDWSPYYGMSPLSGQGWDADGQGSPDFFVDPTTCAAKLYMSGVVMNSAKT